MYYFEYATKDTTLYESSASMNSGLDEILEIQKIGSSLEEIITVSRALIKFDLTDISSSISNGTISNPKYYLNLYDAGSEELNTVQTLYGYPVSQSWDMGSGRFDSNPIVKEGASWTYRDNDDTSTYWTSAISASGGTWHSGSGYEASQSFTHEPADLRMDVTDIVNKWVDSTIPNEGFMLKRSGSIGNTNVSASEGNTVHYGNFKFFSRETHTVFQPKLEVEWDDSTWTTGSLSALSNTDVEDMILYMKGVRPEYQETSKTKFRVVGRERYPVKTFSTTSDYLTVKTLPSGSTYYSIRDAHTEDVIIPFGNGSKVSCDSTGNYFNLWMNGLQSERFYRVLFKVVSGSGTAGETVQYFDENWTFKVSR